MAHEFRDLFITGMAYAHVPPSYTTGSLGVLTGLVVMTLAELLVSAFRPKFLDQYFLLQPQTETPSVL